jgi:ribosomal protein L13E
MGKSVAKQLEIMFRFIESKHLLGELRKHDWAGFAYHYNGEGYKQNQYDDKLRTAYEKHRSQGRFAGRSEDALRDHPPPKESIRTSFDPNRPIDWNDNNCRVSRHFTVGEVTNKDPQRRPQKGSQVEKNCLALARALDEVREQWGGPIGVTSWYRPEHVNRAVGGVPGSQHILGLAADIYTFDVSREREFEDWLDRGLWKDKALGYGVRSGRGFTHVDLRAGRIRWTY